MAHFNNIFCINLKLTHADSAVALLYHQEFFKQQFKGGVKSNLPGSATLTHGCQPVSTATALPVEIIRHLLLIFGTHRLLLT